VKRSLNDIKELEAQIAVIAVQCRNSARRVS